MNSVATTVPLVIVALVLLLLAIGEDPGSALVLQNGVPGTVVTISQARSQDGPVYTMTLSEIGGSDTATVIAEPSDVSASTYLIHETGQAPALLSLAPVLSRLAVAGNRAIREVSIDDQTDAGIGSTLYLVREGGTTLLTSPDTGITILVSE